MPRGLTSLSATNKGIAVRRLATHAFLSAAFMVAAIAAVHPAPAFADEPSDPFGSVTIESTSIDMADRRPTVVVRLTCNVDISFVRVRAVLTQRAQVTGTGTSPAASSLQTRDVACVANETLDVAVDFGPQQGTFTPGRAEVSGFVAAFALAAVRTIPSTVITLRPLRSLGPVLD
jgi:hypothetical protein